MAVSTPPRPIRVAVLGGGVAGMSAAHELAERGFEVDVYERQPVYVGGKARSVDVPADRLIKLPPVPPTGPATAAGVAMPAPGPNPPPGPQARPDLPPTTRCRSLSRARSWLSTTLSRCS